MAPYLQGALHPAHQHSLLGFSFAEHQAPSPNNAEWCVVCSTLRHAATDSRSQLNLHNLLKLTHQIAKELYRCSKGLGQQGAPQLPPKCVMNCKMGLVSGYGMPCRL